MHTHTRMEEHPHKKTTLHTSLLPTTIPFSFFSIFPLLSYEKSCHYCKHSTIYSAGEKKKGGGGTEYECRLWWNNKKMDVIVLNSSKSIKEAVCYLSPKTTTVYHLLLWYAGPFFLLFIFSHFSHSLKEISSNLLFLFFFSTFLLKSIAKDFICECYKDSFNRWVGRCLLSDMHLALGVSWWMKIYIYIYTFFSESWFSLLLS